MKILSNKQYSELFEAKNKAYTQGFEAGRENALQEDFNQDINFTDIMFVFDFYNPDIKVFSIERVNPVSRDEHTLIGYITKDGEIKQWHFGCSRSHHNRLVEQWQQAKASPFVTKKK